MKRHNTILLILLGILLFGAVQAAGDGASAWPNGWLVFSLLLALVVGILTLVLRIVIGSQVERSLLLAVAGALLLRMLIGAVLTQLLPVVGYTDSKEHQGGYAFTDAYIRDRQAWELANSGEALTNAFTGQYTGDQYGGLLSLEALLYRTLSLDYHRQTLVLTLTAGAGAIGVIFVWKACQAWFGRKIAGVAAWIFALYPESLLLGSSQMREAFVISALAITIYSFSQIPEGFRRGDKSFSWLGWLAVGMVILRLFQPPMLVIAVFILLVFWLLDPQKGLARKRQRGIGVGVLLAGLLVAALLIVASIWTSLPSLRNSNPLSIITDWLGYNFAFQTHLTERASGMFQMLLESAGEQWTWLLVMVYGLAQPVLPAVVGDPDAASIMRWIGFFRAAGWYSLAPFLVYGTLAAFRARHEERRGQLIFLNLIVWGWAIVAAFNGGADQWDTPRYRTLLLAWQVVLAAWAWGWARVQQDAWLGRWLAIEAVFIGIFTEWYASRYFPTLPHLDIFTTIAVTLLITGLILITGWLQDRRKRAQ